MGFLETVMTEYNTMRARSFAGDGYEGVTHAGIAIVAEDTGLVFMAQRAMDPTDAPDVQQTWEFPGGGLNEGEEPYPGAVRELVEETCCGLPEGMVVNGWRSPNGVYQGFVYATPTAFSLDGWVPTEEVQAVAWVPTRANRDMPLRPELADFDWTLLDLEPVSGNEENKMTEAATEPEFDPTDFAPGPLPVHGVLAPEDVETGDQRGFNAGSMTARPLRLPFAWQKVSIGGHDGSVVVGSVDRLMRKDGLIHWEGALMPCPEADEFTDLLAFFGRFGVSVDGDKGVMDKDKTLATGVLWFDAVRASGLTAVSIPAFAEAYVAFGYHPEMPPEINAETLAASVLTAADFAGARETFDRGPGWVTDPGATNRIHDYWTKKGEEGYAKVGWGTPGDFRRAKALIGAKIAEHSPDKMKYLNQIIAQWHFDALGYWPGDLDKPGNKTSAEARAEHSSETIEAAPTEPQWEAVLVSSATGKRAYPPPSYFERHPTTENCVIEEPDEFGLRRTYGYAGEWGVCHIGFDGRCVEMPEDPTGNFAHFHLGRTKVEGGGYIKTGLITYGVEHRDAEEILAQTPTRAHFEDLSCAWAAVRVGEDDRGTWFSGVVLPTVTEEWITTIEASGQVSGEWKHGALRTILTVNVPGFPVVESSAVYGDDGEVLALAASAFGGGLCAPSPADRMEALRLIDAEVRFAALRAQFIAERGA